MYSQVNCASFTELDFSGFNICRDTHPDFYFCRMLSRLFRKFFPSLNLLIFLVFGVNAQEIIVNEYYNASSQSDEWTELVVVKDDLDLRGWYLGDNNAATSSWQPKIQFNPNNAFWNHMRAGTVIVLDHASGTDESNCDDQSKYDYDKSDGFVRMCVRDPDYFLGGSTTTLFLADGGDFVQIVNPSGKMIHGIGHDASPGGSVQGSPCFSSSANWTDINGTNADTPPCPNGPFTYYKFGMSAPTSLKMICGTLPEFSSGMQESSSNPVIDTTDTAFEGIGNGTFNNQWLTELRAPDFEAQTICPVMLPTGAISLTWNSILDPLPSDQTCGYMVVRNSTGNFGLPPQGKEFTVGSSYGSGNQTVTVAALLDHTGAATITYSETGPGNFFYRIFLFRYKNTPGFEHPTRGRTYNTVEFVKVNGGSVPAIPVINDTLCLPGLATLIVPPFAMPNPSGIAWYLTATGGNPILINQDTLRYAVSQTTSFWVDFPNASWCNGQRIEVKALVQTPLASYQNPDSVCEGVPAVLVGETRAGLQYKWKVLSAPPAVTFSGYDSALFSISTPATSKKEWIVFSVQTSNSDGCQSAVIIDSVYTMPFECSLFSEPGFPVAGKPLQVKVKSDRNPWQVGEWIVNKAEVLEKNPVSIRIFPETVSPEVRAEILVPDPRDGIVCKAIRTLNPGIENLVLGQGSAENKTLSFEGKSPEYLRIFNRWGKIAADYGAGYRNEWPDKETGAGIYFFEVKFSDGASAKGWVEYRP